MIDLKGEDEPDRPGVRTDMNPAEATRGQMDRRRCTLMPKFALKYPYFIIMLCLVVALVGTFTIVRMPVDLFPQDRHAGSGRGHLLQRHAAAAD